MTSRHNISVLGAGAWGTALAIATARAGNNVMLWGRDAAVLEQISQDRRNARYLPGIELDAHDGVFPGVTDDINRAVRTADTILIAIPAQQFSTLAKDLSRDGASRKTLVCCAKGIDRTTGNLPAELLASTLSAAESDLRIAALSGPSFAVDVARGLPTAVTIAAEDPRLAADLARLLSSLKFRCYASTDLRGVELGGALKNVIAIAVGAVRGMALGASAEAALVARGFAEMTRLAVAIGAQPQTLTGLSGLGDLVLTCSHTQSRNFAYGMALGHGEPLEGRPLAEGAFTASIAAEIAAAKGIEAPVIDTVAMVLDRRITTGEAVQKLLERPLKTENEEDASGGRLE